LRRNGWPSSLSGVVTDEPEPAQTSTEKSSVPKHLNFTDNGDGTATICGKPKTAGTYHLTIKATFGTGANKYVVTQAFTLTVDSS
jgi:hypothetical protein